MAFSFANVASQLNVDGPGGVKVQDGPELAEIQTDQLGFKGVNGEAKAKLLPEAWPTDNLPIPTASLLSVASSQALLAAGGPDHLIIADTQSIRSALTGNTTENLSSVDPLLTIPHTRLAHVAFSADESVLVVSEQENGGIIAYQAEKLKAKQTQPALKLSTRDTGLRCLVPNPAVQTAHLFACVTIQGDLLLADLSHGNMVEGPQGIVLASNVACLSWSSKGRQLVAGLTDGTAVQIKPDGSIVGRLPKSTSIQDDVHVSGISWLENDIFLVIYTPNTTDLNDGIPSSDYYIVTRDKSQFEFQKLPEILPSFGMERVPTHHFIVRLKEWQPHIVDLLLLSSTTSTEIGMLSKTNQPLNAADPVTNTFTFTTSDDDTRRAALPLSGASDTSPIGMAMDLSAKEGVVNPIPSDPELEQSPGPVPNILILNNEGILCSWWVIYSASIREKTLFSGFAALGAKEQARAAVSPSPPSGQSLEKTMLQSSDGQFNSQDQSMKSNFGLGDSSTTSTFAKPSSTFGQPSSQTSFGTGSAFESISKIGGGNSSWSSTGFSNTAIGKDTSGSGPVFGQTTFGSASSINPTSTSVFGSTNALSQRAPAFGQSSGPGGPAFGQTGFGSSTSASALGTGSAKPFAATGSSSSGTSGFSAFAGSAGFSATATDKKDNAKSSPFGQTAARAFTQNEATQSPFSNASNTSGFGQTSTHSPFVKSSPFGASVPSGGTSSVGGNSMFKLESSFKGDGSAKDDLPKPSGSLGFGFGMGLGDMLGTGKSNQVTSTPNRDESMEDSPDEEQRTTALKSEPQRSDGNGSFNTQPKTLVTPPATLSQPKVTPAQPVASLFGAAMQQMQTPQPAGSNMPWSLPNMTSTTPKETPMIPKTMFNSHISATSTSKFPSTPSTIPPTTEEAPRITTESPSDEDVVNIKHIPQAPLPPDPMSRPGYQAGDTSLSSIDSTKTNDAPLPPDFLPAKKAAISAPQVPDLPADSGPEDEDDDDEEEDNGDDELSSELSSALGGSAEDTTNDVSPTDGEGDEEEQDNDNSEHDQVLPESPLHEAKPAAATTSPTDGLFTTAPGNQQSKPSRPLFGEIGTAAPIFPPPKIQESPRSPSPVRQLLPHDTLRPDLRSVSAPVRQRSAIDQRKADYSQSNNAAKALQARQEETAREQARAVATLKAQEQAHATQLQSLEDDEDERIQHELSQPLQPSESLDSFITYEPTTSKETSKVDIPAQIERLYQDINSMIYTLGINARSLLSYMAYQKGHEKNQSWPAVLRSETPLDAMNDEWFLRDIQGLYDGCTAIESVIQEVNVDRVAQKLESCQTGLTTDLSDLRNKITALRKSLTARIRGSGATVPLSAEQSSIQHDLRQSASTVQTRLVSVEDGLSLLRARLSSLEPSHSTHDQQNLNKQSTKKPTVEAVSNTVAKMTTMAEKRSADVDMLEDQLKRLGLHASNSTTSAPLTEPSTPPQHKSQLPRTPESAGSSVFYTPESKTSGSTKSKRHGTNSAQKVNGSIVVAPEDRRRWQERDKRKQDIASALRNALSQKPAKVIPIGAE